MALSEFMPYGAPELLDGARTRMARSTMVASFAVGVLVLGLGLVLPHGTHLLDLAEIPIIDILPPPLDPPVAYATPHAEPATPSFDPTRMPVPVPDRDAPPELAPDAPVLPTGPVGDQEVGLSRSDAIGRPVAPVVDDPLPGIYDPAVDEFPVLVRSVEARYPDLAREAGVEGLVRVLILVELDGRVKRAIIAPGGSSPLLDEAALEAARKCVFTPALSNNHPVKVWVSRNYRFTLH